MLLLEKYQHGQAQQRRSDQGNPDAIGALPQSLLTRLDATRRSIDETLAPRLDSQTPSSPAPRPTPGMLRPSRQWLGQEARDGQLCFDYSPYRLYAYHRLIMEEMMARGYKVSPEVVGANLPRQNLHSLYRTGRGSLEYSHLSRASGHLPPRMLRQSNRKRDPTRLRKERTRPGSFFAKNQQNALKALISFLNML